MIKCLHMAVRNTTMKVKQDAGKLSQNDYSLFHHPLPSMIPLNQTSKHQLPYIVESRYNGNPGCIETWSEGEMKVIVIWRWSFYRFYRLRSKRFGGTIKGQCLEGFSTITAENFTRSLANFHCQ